MAVNAPLSKFKRNNLIIYIVILLAASAYFAYDGHLNESFIEKHTKNYGTPEAKPDGTLVFNRKAPFVLLPLAGILGIYLAAVINKKVVADEQRLKVNNKEIPYDSIEAIDKTNYESKGYYIIKYKDSSGNPQQQKISRNTYDNTDELLDELVAKIS